MLLIFVGDVVFVVALCLLVLGRRQRCCCFRRVVDAVYSCRAGCWSTAAVVGLGIEVTANCAAPCCVCLYWARTILGERGPLGPYGHIPSFLGVNYSKACSDITIDPRVVA